MNEQEWSDCRDPLRMWNFLPNKAASARKSRLFAVACCRRLECLSTDQGERQSIEVAERMADGRASNPERIGWRNRIGSSPMSMVFAHAASPLGWQAAEYAMRGAGFTADERAEKATQSDLLRDIFGNPFRPVSVDPSWLTSTVIAFAQQLYESRDFTAMPILADALQDADCTEPAVLEHCRCDGPHVRGCWLIDLLLGKS